MGQEMEEIDRNNGCYESCTEDMTEGCHNYMLMHKTNCSQGVLGII